jgi:hypothetical protein
LKRGLLPKIIRFRRSSKGVSTVIGTIFLVIIALTVATNVFLWTLTQNAAYNQAVKESSQMDADISSERIVAYNTVYLVSPDNVEVTTTMTAQGALSAQIITVWVTWTDGNDIKYGSATVNINVTAGDPIVRTINVTVPGALDISGDTCNGWLVTARGNRVPLELKKVDVIKIADVSLGIGAIAMNFSNFKYFEVDDGMLLNYPQGTSAFELESGKSTVLAVYLTNYDKSNRTITLSSRSMLWAYFPKAPGNPGQWYITNVNATGAIVEPYSNVTLAHMESKWIYFGPGTLQVKDASGAVNLILLGTTGSEDYGQNIPFVSIYVKP